MSIPNKIKEFLDSNQVAYQHCTHSPAYTAQGLAHVEHISGKELAKVVMVMANGHMVMTVLPGSHRVDLDQLAGLLKSSNVRLATEEEFKDFFPDCELGAMPPFGNLYHLDVWVDSSLSALQTITFSAGTHIETIRMNFADYRQIVKPQMGAFGVLRH